MSKAKSDTIILVNTGINNIQERKANEAITPGHIVEILSDGDIQKNDSGYTSGVGVALENEIVGADKTTAYASGDIVRYAVLPRGSKVQLRLPASAAAIVIGDRLTVATGGVVQKLTAQADLTDSTTGTANDVVQDVTGSHSQSTLNNNFADLTAKINALLPNALPVFAIALEAIDNSAGGSEVFIYAEVA